MALVASLCLLVPDELQAQSGRGGGGRGGYGGGGRGGYGGGYGGYGYPYSGYGSTLGGSNYEPSYYNYSTPQVYTSPSYFNTPGIVSVGPNVTMQQSGYYNPAQSTTASVDVRVPADAKVWFDGTPTTMTGADRVFTSPPLDTGKTYHYEVKAQWMQDGKPVEKTLSIPVAAGQRSLADFMTR
jgi:uncharacterized protein (TIGR03000 family)